MTKFASLSLNLTDHGFYLGQLALAALFFSGYYLVMFCYKKKVKYSIKISLQVALILAIILFPIILNKLLKITFFSMIFLNMLTMSAALKLISFLFVANEISNVLKIIEREGVKKDERLKYFKDYSINQENFDLIYERGDLLTIITLKDFFVYTFMPTLCFQLVYPRTDRIRPLNLIKNSFLFIITIMILL